MTPMIDVVFLLIIFFLVSNTMNRQETSMVLELPKASTGRDREIVETKRLLLNIPADSNIYAGAAPVTIEELETLLERLKVSGSEGPEVHIRVDKSVQYSVIEPILVSCAESGIWNVSFSVIRK